MGAFLKLTLLSLIIASGVGMCVGVVILYQPTTVTKSDPFIDELSEIHKEHSRRLDDSRDDPITCEQLDKEHARNVIECHRRYNRSLPHDYQNMGP